MNPLSHIALQVCKARINIFRSLKKEYTSILICGFLLTSCAQTPTKKVYQNMLLAGAAGVYVGQQKEDFRATHSMMYGSLAAAIAAAATLYFNDPDKEIETLRKQNKDLAQSLNEFSGLGESTHYQKKLSSGAALNNFQSLPQKYRKLISPGEWTLMEIDEWERIDENKLVHKTQLLEIKPPILNQQ